MMPTFALGRSNNTGWSRVRGLKIAPGHSRLAFDDQEKGRTVVHRGRIYRQDVRLYILFYDLMISLFPIAEEAANRGGCISGLETMKSPQGES